MQLYVMHNSSYMHAQLIHTYLYSWPTWNKINTLADRQLRLCYMPQIPLSKGLDCICEAWNRKLRQLPLLSNGSILALFSQWTWTCWVSSLLQLQDWPRQAINMEAKNIRTYKLVVHDDSNISHKIIELRSKCTLSPLLSITFLTSSSMLIPLVSMLPTAVRLRNKGKGIFYV